jgi:hypothetical protein
VEFLIVRFLSLDRIGQNLSLHLISVIHFHLSHLSILELALVGYQQEVVEPVQGRALVQVQEQGQVRALVLVQVLVQEQGQGRVRALVQVLVLGRGQEQALVQGQGRGQALVQGQVREQVLVLVQERALV